MLHFTSLAGRRRSKVGIEVVSVCRIVATVQRERWRAEGSVRGKLEQSQETRTCSNGF